ncbi:MAG: hypothetical protein E4H01_06305 [Lysobacterales bacterium]|nr:MAG: hypothetical protein E4H01_06305 [Xanthomonadales bacterium]
MNKLVALAFGSLFLVALPFTATASGHAAKIQNYVDTDIRSWLASDELQSAIYQQNLNHVGLTDADINYLDLQWRAEKEVGGGDLISSRMNNQLSSFLRGIKAASKGVITEIFVMDNKGLNVGQTNGTGDYMQGDEAKWLKTYPVSAYAVFIDDVEEEDGINISQTSLTVARQNGFRLGAVTIGINVDALK